MDLLLNIVALLPFVCASNIIPFTVLSPHPDQIIIGDMFFIVVKFQSNKFELGKDGSFCISLRSISVSYSECFDSMEQSYFFHDNDVFSLLIEVSWHEQLEMYFDFFIMGTNGVMSHSAHRTIRTVAPFIDGSPNPNVLSPGMRNTIADSTVLDESEMDILQMRIREHDADISIWDESNAYFTKIPKKYTLHDPAQSHASESEEVGGANKIFEVSTREFFRQTGLKDTISQRSLPPRPMVVMHRNALAQPSGNMSSSGGSSGKNECSIIDDEGAMRDSVATAVQWLHTKYGDNNCGDPPLCRAGEAGRVIESTVSAAAKGGSMLCSATLPDLYIISDSDEILHRRALTLLRSSPHLLSATSDNPAQKDTVVVVSLVHHVLQLNWKLDTLFGLHSREVAFVAPSSLAKKFSACQFPGDQITATSVRRMYRYDHTSTWISVLSGYNVVMWDAMGWHLSSMRAIHAESIIRKSVDVIFKIGAEVWTEERCEVIKQIGVPHYMVTGGGGIEDIMKMWPRFIPSDELLGTGNEANRSDRNSNDHCKLPLAACEDRDLLRRHTRDEDMSLEKRKNVLENILHEVALIRPNSVIYHAPKDAGEKIEFSCLPGFTADTVEIQQKLFCVNEHFAVAFSKSGLVAYCALRTQESSPTRNVISGSCLISFSTGIFLGVGWLLWNMSIEVVVTGRSFACYQLYTLSPVTQE